MSEGIYRQIWELDHRPGNGGASVVSVPVDGSASDLDAQVVLDEQVKASGRRELDLATRPLFRRVAPALLARPTYQALRRLFDNYVVNYRAMEVATPEEEEEERAFVSVIDRTEVMDAAFDYISTRLRPGLTRQRFRDHVHRIWFVRYTNYYNGRSTHHACGFEHVFVGEGKYQPRSGAAATKGEISGYHSWVKFYLDEVSERVNFLGYKYDLQGGQGPDEPRVVTLQMVWNHQDFDGNLQVQLFKRKGGFFVGSSPEAEMALGTVAFFESAAGLVNDEVIVTLGDDGRRFKLVMYRNVHQDGRRGAHIRTFFPEYLGDGRERPMGAGTVMRPVRPELANAGPVIIAAAMVDPAGVGDATGEWIRLENIGEAPVELTGWELRDRSQRPLPVAGVLDTGETRRFEVVRRPNGFALGNKGGLITLHDATGALRAAVAYRTSSEGEEVFFPRTGVP